MPHVKLEDVWKIYKEKKKTVEVLRGINLEIDKGDFVVVLGPSGEGKTTILRIISGLLRQDKGHVYLRGKLVDDMSPKDRNVAMVPQNYAVYPFMTVFDNIAFPLKIEHVPKDEIKKKVVEVSEMLKIDNLLDRKPSQLSGGQLQRVAIARALVKNADIILMDEPLSNLDAQVRVIAREELKELQQKLGPTIIYVTHDQAEALSLATKLALLHEGKIQAYGDPLELYRQPNNAWVGSFLGNPAMNLIRAEVSGEKIEFDGQTIPLPERFKGVLNTNKVILGIRPENIEISQDGDVEGVVELLEELGSFTIIHVKVGNDIIKVIDKAFIKREKGEKLKLKLDYTKIELFDADSGVNLMVKND
ncbi:ABC transporter ATP-binding protein [Acidianus sp. HS-5]|uniref:ABC transporter ATP-binding protein n=1 Tax=Acidianus sp. HS-5 TaxID=2886040 RepID=UPI001F1AC794|nr:ABC transporter ATP-binding protein [Acidianus sp. HS-5]BDC18684.1 ABC transporter ATP-binding protein [Acidianus sp. HS-5]